MSDSSRWANGSSRYKGYRSSQFTNWVIGFLTCYIAINKHVNNILIPPIITTTIIRLGKEILNSEKFYGKYYWSV